MRHGNQGRLDTYGKGEGNKTAKYEMTPTLKTCKSEGKPRELVHTALSEQNMAIPGKTIERSFNIKPEHAPPLPSISGWPSPTAI